MRQAVELVGIVNLVLFAAIAVVCGAAMAPGAGRNTGLWAALAFVSLAWVIVASRVFPTDPEDARRKDRRADRPRDPPPLSVPALSLLVGVLAGEAPARAVRGHAERAARDRDVRASVPARRGRGVAVVVRALRDRLPRPLVGAADARRGPALACRTLRGDRRAAADADARVRVHWRSPWRSSARRGRRRRRIGRRARGRR